MTDFPHEPDEAQRRGEDHTNVRRTRRAELNAAMPINELGEPPAWQ
jgi:hypothetical protein